MFRVGAGSGFGFTVLFFMQYTQLQGVLDLVPIAFNHLFDCKTVSSFAPAGQPDR